MKPADPGVYLEVLPSTDDELAIASALRTHLVVALRAGRVYWIDDPVGVRAELKKSGIPKLLLADAAIPTPSRGQLRRMRTKRRIELRRQARAARSRFVVPDYWPIASTFRPLIELVLFPLPPADLRDRARDDNLNGVRHLDIKPGEEAEIEFAPTWRISLVEIATPRADEIVIRSMRSGGGECEFLCAPVSLQALPRDDVGHVVIDRRAFGGGGVAGLSIRFENVSAEHEAHIAIRAWGFCDKEEGQRCTCS